MGHVTSCAYQKIGCHSPRILIVNKRSGRKTYQTIRVIQSDPLIPSSFQVTYVPVNFWKGPRNHPPKNTQQNDKQIISKTTLIIPFSKKTTIWIQKTGTHFGCVYRLLYI